MRLATIFGAACLGSLPFSAQASIELGINADAQIESNYIDFGQFPNGAPYTPPPGYGTFEVVLVTPGVFSTAGVTVGESGMIQSLNEGPGPVTLPGPFMTFDSGGSNLQLWVTNIPAGNAGPFTLTNTPDGAVGSFTLDGYVWDKTTNSKVDTFTGTFSAVFNGQTVADLLRNLPITTPVVAAFTVSAVTVPEPGTWALMLVGVGAMGARLRTARRRAGLPAV